MAESYTVVREFKDNKNGGHVYQVGDSYPMDGHKATKARINQLVTSNNKYGQVFIEQIKDSKE